MVFLPQPPGGVMWSPLTRHPWLVPHLGNQRGTGTAEVVAPHELTMVHSGSSIRKGKDAMRRLFLAFTALMLLSAFIGCRHVGGVCDCYGYCCYPPCYGPCAQQGGGCGAGGCGAGGCSSCGGGGGNFAAPATGAVYPSNNMPNETPSNTGKVLPSAKY